MEGDTRSGQQALEPVLQEEVPFKDHTITAVKLADGRYAVVLRWVCEVLNLDPSGQVQRIQRTAAIADELLRAKIEPRTGGEKPRRGGGPQIMPILTLRGFSPWILGINPNEVEEDPKRPGQAEHIRQMIIAYQQEAIDVLYTYFMRKAESRPAIASPRALPAPAEQQVIEAPSTSTAIAARPASGGAVLAPIDEPGPEATHHQKAAYHELMSVWHRHQADLHAQAWRVEVSVRIEDHEARMEAKEALTDLIPDILERLGPPRITVRQQNLIQKYVSLVHQATGQHQQTIFAALKTRFRVPRYDEIPLSEWPNVVNWFKRQLPMQPELFDSEEE